jgi:hypothetical protein
MAGALLLWPFGAHGEDRLPPVAVEAPSLSEMAPLPRNEAEASGYHIAIIAAGAVVGVVAANFITGGMITPLLAAGTGTAMATAPAGTSGLGPAAIAVFVATEAAWLVFDLTVEASAPAAMVSVAAPVDAALRDGYTTPTTLAIAFGESASQAGTVVRDIGAYLGATARSWWDGS